VIGHGGEEASRSATSTGPGEATSLAVWLTGPRQVAVREAPVASPGFREALVVAEVSAISAGTELLVYRGLVDEGMALDATIPALGGLATFPLRYGYSTVGVVRAVGLGVGPEWLDRRVLAFHPHESRFVARVDALTPIPDGMPAETAALLPTMETAVTLIMDGQPLLGERVVLFGQGSVGLATTALLARMPLALLVTLDRHALRRQTSLALGATESLDPEAPETAARLAELLGAGEGAAGADPFAADPLGAESPAADSPGADLVYELSGQGEALDAALGVAGFGARVVVGSWYGKEPVALQLGGSFHRGRVRLLASQVSTLGAEHAARWTKRRRLQTALAALTHLPAERLITHRLPVARAAEAYALLDERPQEAIQVLLTYGDAADRATCTP
jgi:2-desacetyl-2-hydroxyethyl bacteriochlorophyllide A dehydrogenase